MTFRSEEDEEEVHNWECIWRKEWMENSMAGRVVSWDFCYVWIFLMAHVHCAASGRGQSWCSVWFYFWISGYQRDCTGTGAGVPAQQPVEHLKNVLLNRTPHSVDKRNVVQISKCRLFLFVFQQQNNNILFEMTTNVTFKNPTSPAIVEIHTFHSNAPFTSAPCMKRECKTFSFVIEPICVTPRLWQ